MSSLHSDRRGSQRGSIVRENFRTFPAFEGSRSSNIDTRRERGRWLGFPKPNATPDIATVLSPSGWLATASLHKVRFFRYSDKDPTSELKCFDSIECKDKIRDLAASDDLLALVTYSHLLVYTVKDSSRNSVTEIVRKLLDQPRSVAIRQVGLARRGLASRAWVAVGGEGKIGMRIFRYSYEGSWNAQSASITLSCSQDLSYTKIVGFSQDRSNSSNYGIVFAVTQSKLIYCWSLGPDYDQYPSPKADWIFDCNAREKGQPWQGEIMSASVFITPSKRPYLFCANKQTEGSKVLRSCTTFIDDAQRGQEKIIDQWRELPEQAIGSNALCGTVTNNGHFIVAVENGVMRLLTLQGSYQGGLTSLPEQLKWKVPLSASADGVSGVSVLVKEEQGALEIIAADGHGHVAFRRVSVPQMPAPPSPRISIIASNELSNTESRGELPGQDTSSQNTSQRSGSTASTDQVQVGVEAILS